MADARWFFVLTKKDGETKLEAGGSPAMILAWGTPLTVIPFLVISSQMHEITRAAIVIMCVAIHGFLTWYWMCRVQRPRGVRN